MKEKNRIQGKYQLALITCMMMLAITVTPPMTGQVFAGTAGDPAAKADRHWSETIPRMLQAGDYREGVVFAGIDLRQVDRIEDVAKNAEEVMTVDASAADAAVTEETGASSEADGEAALQMNAADQEDCISITCIQEKGKTTEQILNELAKDDSVVFAEPDYILEEQADESNGTKNTGGTAVKKASGISDLTPLQWSSSDSATLHAEGVKGGVSINVPGFDEQESNMEGNPVVIAVIDMPIDFSNPDLKDVAYTFTEEEQEALGCDVHGYNAAWQCPDGKLKLWPGASHGTHCAGIIGASWDGHGISGVASNVRLISIQCCIEDGRTSLVNTLRGMAFVKRANEEFNANIRITSNSWGLNQSSRALDAAIRELGNEQGIISFISAGNDGTDLSGMDSLVDTLHNNPYAVTVASTDPEGLLSYFSSYSDQLVTLGAPGSGILSTVPLEDSIFIPMATLDTNRFYENFESINGPGITFLQYDEDMNPYEVPQDITGREGMGFEGERAMRITLDPEQCAVEGGETTFTIGMELGDLSEMGVQAGDYLGFAFGMPVYAFVSGYSYYNAETGDWIPFGDESGYARGQCFEHASAQIPEGADLSDLKIAADFCCDITEEPVIYLDTIGFGTQTVPYGVKSGTSMACPAAAGGAAVLAARYPEVKGAELARLVKSSVRSMSSLEGKTQTGGILDLSVDVSPESAKAGPVITSASLKDRKVTIKGSHFGSKAGTATLEKLTPGIAGEKQSFSISSWSDRKVILKLKKDFKGIAQVSLKARTSGKKDIYTWFVSKSDWVYGTDLPLDKGTGAPLTFDGNGDWEAAGPMQVMNGKLYFLPALKKVEEQPGHQKLMVYDTASKKWSSAPAKLPVWLENTSAAVHDGKLIVKGAVMEVTDGIPHRAEKPQAAVYAYDPVVNSWTECSAANVSLADTLVAYNDELILVGSVHPDKKDISIVREYDPADGSGGTLAELKNTYTNAQAAVSDGVLYVYDRSYYRMESVDFRAGARSEECELPEYVDQPASAGNERLLSQSKRNGVLVAVSGGVLLIGPPAADGSSDTFLLKKGKSSFTACPRRLSEDRVMTLTAAAAGDRVYSIASSMEEPDNRLFRTETLKNITTKPANPMKVKAKKVTLKAKTLKKRPVKVKASKAYTVWDAQGKVTYRKVKLNKKKYNGKFLVNESNGNITVKKGVKKGTYKLTVKIRAAGNKHYATGTKNVKVTIQVK